MRKHRTLVDRSFVGDLADVKRRRFRKQNGAADPGGSAAARFRQRVEKVRERFSHPRGGEQHRSGRVPGELGREFPAGIEIGNQIDN